MIQRLKIIYILYNFFNKKKLQHNLRLYKQFGIKKNYFSPVSSADFKHIRTPTSISSNTNFKLEKTPLFNSLNSTSKESLLQFHQQGFAIITNHFDNVTIEKINNTIDDLLKNKEISFNNSNKLMFAIHKSNFLKNIGEDEKLVNLLACLVNDDVQLFQSINFTMGSEQHTHSDSIHMTTYPLGGLLGVWIALEDIDLDNGPLHYYPGSHKLPYYLNEDYDNKGNFFLLGNKDYTEYEKMVEQKMQEHSMQKQVFTAKKGDVLIWHANLFHGGEPHINKTKTRKSMVLHYFAKNCICYHEIKQRPALIK